MKKFGSCLLMTILIAALLCPQAAYAANEESAYYIHYNSDIPLMEEENQQTKGNEASLNLSAPSVILLEASTGKTIYENNSTQRLRPASITKIMTLLLIMESLKSGKITLQDEVMTSDYAKSMGGSQVFLESGEIQTVDTLIKCIAVASGNDASVAMAEYLAGSESEFVRKMNERAKQLGMNDTNFEDCCGLTSSENHYTTAKDVASMSKELIIKHPEIYQYTKIWMEDITHNTAKGSSTFTLSSTNKLLKQYEWATGLKTGSTSLAKYCLSATASKDGIDLIAVVMAAPDYKVRFADAITLLNYGFSISRIYKDENKEKLEPIVLRHGILESVPVVYEGEFSYLDVTGKELNGIEKKMEWNETIEAPVKKGEKAGAAKYFLEGKEIGEVPILFAQTVERAVYKDYLKKVIGKFLL